MKAKATQVPVRLEARVNPIGTVDLWCVSQADPRRWLLEIGFSVGDNRAGGDETIREYSSRLAIALPRRHAGLEEDEMASAELRTKILDNKGNPPIVSRTISA